MGINSSEAKQTNPTENVGKLCLEGIKLEQLIKKNSRRFGGLDSVRKKLLAQLKPRIAKLTATQTAWERLRGLPVGATKKADARRDAEHVRGELLGAISFHSEGSDAIDAELARIRQGDGVADLIQDLRDAVALSQRPEVKKALKADASLDKTLPVRAGQLAELLEGVTDTGAAATAASARNVAFAEAMESVRVARATLRWYLRNEPKLLAQMPMSDGAHRMRTIRTPSTTPA